MKKVSRTIAVVLVLLMLACSFTSCLSYVYRSSPTLHRVGFAVVDIVFLPVSLIALLIYVIVTDASGEMDYQTYMANAGDNVSAEYLSLMNKIYSLPDAEFASLKQILDSIPEGERNSLIERINALSETERVSLVSAYTSLPETEVISSIGRINALSETERVSLLQDFVLLSETEIASLIEELESLHEETDNVAVMDFVPKNVYTMLSFENVATVLP